MRIAVATTDGVQVSPHFGRSAGFVIYQVEGTAIKDRQLRSNQHTPHAQGLCEGHHEHAQGHSGHSHSDILQLLQDCEVVLCGGMGSGAAQALTASGIRTQLVPLPSSVDNALQQFLSGTIPATDNVHCTCHS
jgi:predicted Fe-Mo cluster-binding NifX family protein